MTPYPAPTRCGISSGPFAKDRATFRADSRLPDATDLGAVGPTLDRNRLTWLIVNCCFLNRKFFTSGFHCQYALDDSVDGLKKLALIGGNRKLPEPKWSIRSEGR